MVPVTEVATGLAAPLPVPPSVEYAGQRVLDAEEQRCWNHSVANVLVQMPRRRKLLTETGIRPVNTGRSTGVPEANGEEVPSKGIIYESSTRSVAAFYSFLPTQFCASHTVHAAVNLQSRPRGDEPGEHTA